MDQERFERKQHMIEVLYHFKRSLECIMCPGGVFADSKIHRESGIKLAKEYFPDITDEQLKGFEDHPHDRYAQLTETMPVYPWISGSSHREYFGLLLGRKENEE